MIRAIYIIMLLLIGNVFAIEPIPIMKIPIGTQTNATGVDREQLGLSFTIDENENIWLVDIHSPQIKAFDQNGHFLYAIKNKNTSISPLRLHVLGDFVVSLWSDCSLYFNKKEDGELFYCKVLNVDNAIANKAYFYKNYIFLPQFGKPFPNENMCKVRILIKKEEKTAVSVEIIDALQNTYVPNNTFQFLPVDSSASILYGLINPIEFKGQSTKFILIGKDLGDIKKECYYLYVKADKSFRKIGYPSEKVTGFITDYGWGWSSTFVDNYLYFIGVKYDKKTPPKNPIEIIVSKIDLKNVVSEPAVEFP